MISDVDVALVYRQKASASGLKDSGLLCIPQTRFVTCIPPSLGIPSEPVLYTMNRTQARLVSTLHCEASNKGS